MNSELIPERLPEDVAMPFWEHVGELRSRLIHVVIVLAGVMSIAYWRRFDLWLWAQRPLLSALGKQGADVFAFTDLVEPFSVLLRLSFWCAVFVASPFLFYQVWAFLRPALASVQRRNAVVFVTVTSICFAAGAAFAYCVLMPALTRLLLAEAAMAGLRANVRPEPYLNLLLGVIAGTGLCFEAPVMFWFLGSWGLVTRRGMIAYWREAIIITLASAAFLTPGDLVVTTLLFGGVLLALYACSIIVVEIATRRKK